MVSERTLTAERLTSVTSEVQDSFYSFLLTLIFDIKGEFS